MKSRQISWFSNFLSILNQKHQFNQNKINIIESFSKSKQSKKPEKVLPWILYGRFSKKRAGTVFSLGLDWFSWLDWLSDHLIFFIWNWLKPEKSSNFPLGFEPFLWGQTGEPSKSKMSLLQLTSYLKGYISRFWVRSSIEHAKIRTRCTFQSYRTRFSAET